MDATNSTVTLGSKVFTVASAGPNMIELVGKRGGKSSLIRNVRHPSMWGHLVMSGFRGVTTWYVRNDDGTFTLSHF